MTEVPSSSVGNYIVVRTRPLIQHLENDKYLGLRWSDQVGVSQQLLVTRFRHTCAIQYVL